MYLRDEPCCSEGSAPKLYRLLEEREKRREEIEDAAK